MIGFIAVLAPSLGAIQRLVCVFEQRFKIDTLLRIACHADACADLYLCSVRLIELFQILAYSPGLGLYQLVG